MVLYLVSLIYNDGFFGSAGKAECGGWYDYVSNTCWAQ